MTYRQSSRHTRREPTIGHTDTGAYNHPSFSSDVLQMLSHRNITAEVLRWPSCRQADPSGFDHIKSRRYLGNSTDYRLKFARISSRIVIDQFDLRTPTLRLAPTLSDHHSCCCCCCYCEPPLDLPTPPPPEDCRRSQQQRLASQEATP
jgi:hypothetical protein